MIRLSISYETSRMKRVVPLALFDPFERDRQIEPALVAGGFAFSPHRAVGHDAERVRGRPPHKAQAPVGDGADKGRVSAGILIRDIWVGRRSLRIHSKRGARVVDA